MATALIVAALALGGLWWGQRAFIYFPSGEAPPPGAAGLTRAEPVSFETEDELRLDGWFVPADRPGTGHTVLVCNGNAGNRADRAELAAQLAARGLAVLLFDYRGFGGNPGLSSETGLARDARAALAYLGRRPDVDVRRLVFLGESLGAAIAVRLAVAYAPAALVLRSPFTSLVNLGQEHYPFLPVRWLLRDRFLTSERIGRITSPLVVVAGELDRIVPIDESHAVFDAAPEPKTFRLVAGADHNDRELALTATVRAVVEVVELF